VLFRSNVAEVIRAGAAGVAVISAVTLADDMVEATRRLRAQVDAALGR
jgi:thiamine monophosphate synthase